MLKHNIKKFLGTTCLAAGLIGQSAIATPLKVIVSFNDGVDTTAEKTKLQNDVGMTDINDFNGFIKAIAGTIDDSNKATIEGWAEVASVIDDNDQALLPTFIDHGQSIMPDPNGKSKRLSITKGIIGFDTVHAAGETGQDAKVCILDTGIMMGPGHANLPAPYISKNFLNAALTAHDGHGHGTHCAGIVASNHASFTGGAPDAKLAIGKVLSDAGAGTYAGVISGIQWCVNVAQAKVISMSLGGGAYTGSCDSHPAAAAVNAAEAAGVVVVIASGNNGYTDKVSLPACARNSIAVGATTNSDVIASFSNGGLKLNVVAQGNPVNSTWNDGLFRALSGTSMATPQVAALVAVMLAADNTSRTPATYKALIERSAKDLGPTGYDYRYGHGRIDAVKAVKFVKEICKWARDLSVEGTDCTACPTCPTCPEPPSSGADLSAALSPKLLLGLVGGAGVAALFGFL